MKNFRITNGDLALASNGRVDMVRGQDKLSQDLTLWILEPIGQGFTTPSFGSILDSFDSNGNHRFIGRNIDAQTLSEIRAEVDRILNLYQQHQIETIKISQIRGELDLYSKKEILNEIVSINADTTPDELTAIIVDAKIRTAAGQSIALAIQSGDEGVRVNA